MVLIGTVCKVKDRSVVCLALVGRHAGDSIVLICHSHIAVVASSIANQRRLWLHTLLCFEQVNKRRRCCQIDLINY